MFYFLQPSTMVAGNRTTWYNRSTPSIVIVRSKQANRHRPSDTKVSETDVSQVTTCQMYVKFFFVEMVNEKQLIRCHFIIMHIMNSSNESRKSRTNESTNSCVGPTNHSQTKLFHIFKQRRLKTGTNVSKFCINIRKIHHNVCELWTVLKTTSIALCPPTLFIAAPVASR